ncbi:MAG: signal peptidase II [Ardenticatenaceae bacterium]|nr:signal peptidase II [Ardenticatenaceae bacterium]
MPYLLIIIIFLADRLSKIWAADFLAENGPTQVHRYLTITETYNRGVAFGMFQGVGPIVGWLTIGVIIGLFIYMVRLPRQLWLVRAGMALIIGGALGNMIDRVSVGAVLDFIQSSLLWGVVNIADISINVGMVVMIIGSIVQKEPEPVVSEPLMDKLELTEEE